MYSPSSMLGMYSKMWNTVWFGGFHCALEIPQSQQVGGLFYGGGDKCETPQAYCFWLLKVYIYISGSWLLHVFPTLKRTRVHEYTLNNVQAPVYTCVESLTVSLIINLIKIDRFFWQNTGFFFYVWVWITFDHSSRYLVWIG